MASESESDPKSAEADAEFARKVPTHILTDSDGTVRDIVPSAIDEGEIPKRAQKILPKGQ